MEALTKVPAWFKLKLETLRSRNAAVDIVMQTFKGFSIADGSTHTAALTYYTFFSIFPLLLFGAALLGYVTLGNETLREDIMDSALNSFPLLRDMFSPKGLDFIERRRQELALTGVVLALYSGTGAIVALEHALNRIHGVRDEATWIGKRIAAARWLLVFGLGAVTSLALGAASSWASGIFDGTTAQVLGWLLGHATGIVVGLMLFATAYRFLPARDATWGQVLPGALLAAILFEVLKEVGGWYLGRGAASREAAFGVFASAAGLLVASFLLAQVILMSAELNDVLAERRRTRRSSMNEAKEDEHD
ncbi:MAG: YihY/virulence factor BrkB family protein [Actinomycetota bacterium]